MQTTMHPVFVPSPVETRRLARIIRWSILVHVGLVLLVALAPRDWFRREPEPRTVMSISLGGTPGPPSTGMRNIGARTVEQIAPPVRLPQPPPAPTPPRETAPPAPAVRTPPQQPARPIDTPRATQPPTRPPVTGRQIARGNARAETGAQTDDGGLSFGGGAAGGTTSLANFCCPAYAEQIRQKVFERWNRNQSGRGTTTIVFTIPRSGRIDQDSIRVETSSGNGNLDRAALAAVMQTQLAPLPPEYTEPTLIVHLKFPYGS
jgi:TonB family protein